MVRRQYNPEERVGISAVEHIVAAKMGWIWREQPIADFGIDAHIEAVGLTVDAEAPTVPTVFGLAAAACPAITAGAVPESLVPLYLRRPDAVERQRPAKAALR